MIKIFCDLCEEEIVDGNTAATSSSGRIVRHRRAENSPREVRVIVGVQGRGSSQGVFSGETTHVCRTCTLDVVATGRDVKYEDDDEVLF